MGSPNGGIIGVINPTSFGKCTVTSATGSTTLTTQPGTRVVDYLVVAGGAGGASWYYGGAGGAGGFRTSYPGGSGGGASPESSLTVCGATPYPITIGAGGAAVSTQFSNGNPGNPSIFSTITSTGGGGGATTGSCSLQPGSGLPGGSGGGASLGTVRTAGQGTANQGYPGSGVSTSPCAGGDNATGSGGGAGGAGTAGVNGPGGTGATGGVGKESTISGSPVFYAGGGGGSIYFGTPGPGGNGGGGAGAGSSGTVQSVAGTANTGGGGGAGSHNANSTGAAGGSGIVIVKELNKASGSWPLRAQFQARKSGTWVQTQTSLDVDYLVVAGGGGGGGGIGGGGGAGGYRTSFPGGTKLTLTGFGPFNVPVTVGAGGAGTGPGPGNAIPSPVNNASVSAPGSPSIFSTITSTGGGYGRHNTLC